MSQDLSDPELCRIFPSVVWGQAFRDHFDHVREDLGPNDGNRIRQYLARVRLPPPQHWCAAALTTWILEAADLLDVPPPIAGSAGALKLKAQFIEAGKWVDRNDVEPAIHLTVGNAVIWWRETRQSGKGHCGIIDSPPDHGTLKLWCFEGNSGPKGDRVAHMRRDLTDPRFLGVGLLGPAPWARKPTDYELAEARRLMDLSDEVMRGEDADPLASFEPR